MILISQRLANKCGHSRDFVSFVVSCGFDMKSAAAFSIALYRRHLRNGYFVKTSS